MMEIQTQDKLLNSKMNCFPWIVLLFGTFLLLFCFCYYYPISTFHSYEGVVEKIESYVVKIYVPQKEFPNLKTSTFYVNHEKREGQIMSVKTSSELGLMAGYYELTLHIVLEDEEKIENNLLQVSILEREETMFQKWKRTWKERINLWLS